MVTKILFCTFELATFIILVATEPITRLVLNPYENIECSWLLNFLIANNSLPPPPPALFRFDYLSSSISTSDIFLLVFLYGVND